MFETLRRLRHLFSTPIFSLLLFYFFTKTISYREMVSHVSKNAEPWSLSRVAWFIWCLKWCLKGVSKVSRTPLMSQNLIEDTHLSAAPCNEAWIGAYKYAFTLWVILKNSEYHLQTIQYFEHLSELWLGSDPVFHIDRWLFSTAP